MKTVIKEIVKVSLTVYGKTNSMLMIEVQGKVNSPNWTNPELDPFVYFVAPKDGIYEFDFVATDPSSATLADKDISVRFKWPYYPKGLKGIKVYSSTNNQIATITTPANTVSIDSIAAPRGFRA